MADLTRDEIFAEAKRLHDRAGCWCDPKYILSCPRLQEQIAPAAANLRSREGDPT